MRRLCASKTRQRILNQMAPRIGGKPPTARPPYPDCKRAGNGNLPQAPSPKRNLSTLPKTIFVVMVLAFAFTTGMALTTIISQVLS